MQRCKKDTNGDLKITLDFRVSTIAALGFVSKQKVINGLSALFPDNSKEISGHLTTHLKGKLGGFSNSNVISFTLENDGNVKLDVNEKILIINKKDNSDNCNKQISKAIIKAYFINLVGNGQLMTKEYVNIHADSTKTDFYFTLDESKAKYILNDNGVVIPK